MPPVRFLRLQHRRALILAEALGTRVSRNAYLVVAREGLVEHHQCAVAEKSMVKPTAAVLFRSLPKSIKYRGCFGEDA